MVPTRGRASVYRFGPFELKSQTGELLKSGCRVRLTEQSCRVLMTLLDRPGELVSREELQQQLWSDGTLVDFDHGLNVAVARLRQALRDNPERPRFIETLPRKGYRFISSVEPIEVRTAIADPNREVMTPQKSGRVLSGRGWAWLIAAVVGFSSVLFWLDHRHAQLSFLSPTVLTSYVGTQHCPSFSPGGDRVAFSWAGDKQDNFDIYVKKIGVEDAPLRLTTDPLPDVSPAWSPNGRSIGFVRLTGTDTAEVVLIPSNSAGPRRHLAQIASPSAIYKDLRLLAWSADSKWLAVSARQSVVATMQLFLVSTETGERRLLLPSSGGYDDLEPAFSPDMSRLAYVRHSGANTGDLFVLELTPELHVKGEPERLTFDNQLIGSPVWTRDGAILVTRYSMAGKPSLWKLKPGSSVALEPLPIAADNALGLAVSSRGDRLVYTRETTNSNIWSMDLPLSPHTEAATRLLIGSSRREYAPSYSPDGQRVAFESSRSGWSEIWIADRDGSHHRQLTNLKGSVASFPRWSPDGRKIVFHSRQKIYASLYIIDLVTSSVHELKYDAVNDTAPSWSHDGKWIYFSSLRTGDSQIWKVPAEGGRASQITSKGGFAPLESADGRFVLYTKFGYGIWQMAASGGDEQEIVSHRVSGTGSAYAPVSNGIYFIREDTGDKEQTLVFFSYAGRQLTTISAIPRPAYLGLAISPEERTLLYTRIDHSNSDLMLVEKF